MNLTNVPAANWWYLAGALGIAVLLALHEMRAVARSFRVGAWIALAVPVCWILYGLTLNPANWPTREYWRGGVVLVPIYYLVTWGFVGAALSFVLSVDPVAAKICGNCGYDMRGNPRGACPDCGHTNAPPDSSRNDL